MKTRTFGCIQNIFCGAVLAIAICNPAFAGDVIFDAQFDEAADSPRSDAEASRFLQQATFGPTLTEIKRLRTIGYNAWFNEQFALSANLHKPYLDFLDTVEVDIYQSHRNEAWFYRAMTANDQLRQRMAFALSEIFVVSDQSSSVDNPFALANYYDMLMNNSFGNYRQLLEEVTLTPVMGNYLSMIRNRKPDAVLNIRPDENYAREIMQLFSIGLFKLNIDGSRELNGGNPIPTYDQNTIRNMAHVFTGWNWAGCTENDYDWCWQGEDGAGWFQPMAPIENFHDRNSKTIFNGIVLPAGVNARPEIENALDQLANHANVAPFIARRLIQRFTSSNPSPAYISAVATKFNNNGSGVRGDLKAVIREVLMHPEARTLQASSTHRGKLREPLVRFLQMWRGLNARADDGRYREWYPMYWAAQGPMESPTVFNFYLPDYQVPGEIATLGLYSPEFQILTDSTITRFNNEIAGRTRGYYRGSPNQEADTVVVDLEREVAIANNSAALVDRYDMLFTGYQLSPFTRTTIINHLNTMPSSNTDQRRERVMDALFILLNSPEYVIGR